MGIPIYELAGQQDDPLAEQILGLLYSDQPVREVVRKDARRHWQWMARGQPNTTASSSRLWISFAGPFTSDTVAEVQVRAQSAVDTLVPYPASSATATAKQISATQIDLSVVAVRADNGSVIDLTISQNEGVGLGA